MFCFSLHQGISVVNNARNGAYGKDRIMAIELKYGGEQKRQFSYVLSSLGRQQRPTESTWICTTCIDKAIEIQGVSVIHTCYF